MARSLQRAYRPAGAARQLLAVMADPDRSAEVATIRCPTLIVHGADDPLVPVQAAYHLKRLLPHAQLQILPKMGHYLPNAVLPELTQMCVTHLRANG
jgi:pimeloyl-ACP methyl ester carboxylesterase